MKNQLYRVAAIIVGLTLAIILLIFPEKADTTFVRLIGGIILLNVIADGLKLYKQYKGKKVFKEFTNQD